MAKRIILIANATHLSIKYYHSRRNENFRCFLLTLLFLRTQFDDHDDNKCNLGVDLKVSAEKFI